MLRATQAQENKVVKQAIKEAGLPLRNVSHGGYGQRNQLIIELDFTAWHHLEHKRQPYFKPNTYQPGRPACFEDCKNCAVRKELEEKAVRIAQEVTGRNERMKKRIYVQFIWCDTSENRERWKYDWAWK